MYRRKKAKVFSKKSFWSLEKIEYCPFYITLKTTFSSIEKEGSVDKEASS